MSHLYLIDIVIIVLSGIISYWIGWLFKTPSIIFLILTGIILGPVFGIIVPKETLGNLYNPLISLGVSIILFEGGLSLNFKKLKNTSKSINRLCIFGPIVSCLSITIVAWYILGFGFQLSLLLGSLLIVTGPTVVGPILKQVKPNKSISDILRWEGILTDPLGAICSVIIFESITSEINTAILPYTANSILISLLSGLLVGFLCAGIAVLIVRLPGTPESIEAPFTLAMVFTAYTISDLIQKESGLLAVTIMGIILANQQYVPIKHILRFKENLVTLVLSSLFIVLAAEINLTELLNISLDQIIFLLLIIFLCRPLAVLLSTLNSEQTWKEKLFIAFMAPRGVVVIAIASIINVELKNANILGADKFTSTIITVVIGTVIFYAITSQILVKILKVGSRSKDGIVILGCNIFSRKLAAALVELKFPVILIDTDRSNIILAKSANLPVVYANIFNSEIQEEIQTQGYGTMLAITSNDELNILSLINASDYMKRNHLFRILPAPSKDNETDPFTNIVSAKSFPGNNLTYEILEKLFYHGAKINILNSNLEPISVKNKEANESDSEKTILPLIKISKQKNIEIITSGELTKSEKEVFYITLEYTPLESTTTSSA